MSDFEGRFVWYELMTDDAAAAQAFYETVVGWTSETNTMTGTPYTMLRAPEGPIAGLMALDEEMKAAGARPGWMGYVGVEDVDGTVERARQSGGHVHHGPDDIPNVGRFAVLGDPHGAVFCLFRPGSEMGANGPTERDPFKPGHVGWHELMAGEMEAAFAFYASLFGWTKAEAMDMGPMGVYQLFACGGQTIGGMMTKPEQVPACYWLYYFTVPGIDAAVERVKAGGGTVINGPMEVPGGSWIVQCLDPQGAMFALTGPKG